MRQPTIITPAVDLPISVEEVKVALSWDGNHFDSEIEDQIKAAVSHYEGWSGILGISIVEKTWRQQFDGLNRDGFCLPIRPVSAVVGVEWADADGVFTAIEADDYEVVTDGSGASFVRFRTAFSHPVGAISSRVDYEAGWPADGVPADIKTAIKLRVQTMMDEAARANSEHLDRIERDLIYKYRRVGV